MTNEDIYRLLGRLYADASARQHFADGRGVNDGMKIGDVGRLVATADLERVARMFSARIHSWIKSAYPRSSKVLPKQFRNEVDAYLAEPILRMGTDPHQIVNEFGRRWQGSLCEQGVSGWVRELAKLEYSMHAARWAPEGPGRALVLTETHDLPHHLRKWPDSNLCCEACSAHIVTVEVEEYGGPIRISRHR